jgi:BASS family bile acid:Na+ symporter
VTPDFVINVAVPVSVVVMMAAVGLDLRLSDLAAVLRRPQVWLTLAVIQFVVLPPVALLLTTLLRVEPGLALSLVAISVAPSGALSNVYTYLARGNVALSVVMTAASLMLSTAFAPALFALASGSLKTEGTAAGLQPLAIGTNLALLVLLPLCVGALVSHLAPRVAQRLRRVSGAAAFAVLAVLVVLCLIVSAPFLPTALRPMLTAGGLFITAALLMGRLAAQPLRPGDRSAVAIEFGVRNLPVAMLLLQGANPDAQHIAYMTTYFAIDMVALIALSLMLRHAIRQSRPCGVS